MCLDYKEEFPLRVKDGYITAWKSIQHNNYGWYRTGHKWNTGTKIAYGPRLDCDQGGGRYHSGFHCWATRKGARHHSKGAKIIKVYIKPENVICTGYQWWDKVVVAKEVEVRSLEHCR